MAKNVYCIKLFLTIVNILLLLRSVFLVGAGVWTLLDKFEYVYLLTYVTYTVLVYMIISAGCLLFFTVITGFVAVYASHKIGLILYIFLLSLIMVMCAMLAISFMVYREHVSQELLLNLNFTMLSKYNVDKDVTFGVDSLQSKFRCCGSDSFLDWKYSTWLMDNDVNLVPDTCCKTVSPNCGTSDHPSNINYLGCRERMEAHMKYHLIILCFTSSSLVEIFGIILACSLYFKLRSETLNISEAKPLYQDRTL